MRAKIRPEQRETAARSMMADGNILKASEASGISPSTIHNKWRAWARELGCTPHRIKIDLADLPDDVKRRAAELKCGGLSNAKTAIQTGLAEGTICAHWREWAQMYGMELPPQQPPKRSGKSAEAKVQQEAERAKRRAVLLKNQGRSTAEVSADTGLSRREISEHWRQWGEKFGIELVEPVEKAESPKNGPVKRYFVAEEDRW